MTWKHSGKTTAFNFIGLDVTVAQEYNIAYSLQDIKSARIFITKQALAMLASLNQFDQQKVVKEIAFVCNNPNSCSSANHSRLPFKRFYRSKDQFRSYHYLIDFKINADNKVVINDIYFDQDLVGAKDRYSLERNMLYNVSREGARYKVH